MGDGSRCNRVGVDLGSTVKDHATGFMGVVVAITDHIGGRREVLVAPTVDLDGVLRDSAWFDVDRVSVHVDLDPRIGVV